MISLSIQFQLILFSFLFGIFFFFLYKISNKAIYCKNIYFRIINTFSFVMGSTLIYFFGIEKICDGILHPYSLLVIIVSFCISNIIANKIKK